MSALHAHYGLDTDIEPGPKKSAKGGSAASRPPTTFHGSSRSSTNISMRILVIHPYPWLSAQTLGVSKYVDAIVAMTPIVMAASAKLNTANDQAS
jgi:hypothetical protein